MRRIGERRDYAATLSNLYPFNLSYYGHPTRGLQGTMYAIPHHEKVTGLGNYLLGTHTYSLDTP